MLSPKINLFSLSSHKIIYFDSMKNLTHAMKDMKITNSFEDLYFLYKFHEVVVSVAWTRIKTSH